MGAGQGKTRRASGLQPTTEPAVIGTMVDERAWKTFVAQSLPPSTKLFSYYLGKDAATSESIDYQKLVSELFADAVAVGAVLLPAPLTADKFEFSTYRNSGREQLTIRAADRSVEREPFLFNPHTYFGKNTPLDAWYVIRSLKEIALAVNKILAAGM